MIESQRISLQHGQNSVQKEYRRQLIVQQKQAYEGAKMFYFGVLPLTMIGLILFTAFLYEQSNDTLRYRTPKIIIYISLTIISYIIAVYYYIKCNKIQTYPAPLSTHSNEQQLQNQSSTSAIVQPLPSLNDNQNLQLHPSSTSSPNKPSRHYCTYCQQLCEYRTRHCHKCQTCIEKYDHHCFWLGNCVGRHNHRQFYLFLLVQSFNNWIEMQVILEVKSYAYAGEFQFHWIIWLTLYSMLLASVGFLCFTGYLAIYHTMLITLSMTTWQQMRRQKISYLKYLPKGLNPFSIGWKQNLHKFFTEQTRASNQNCVLQQWDRFLPTYQEAKLTKPGFNFIDNQYYSCC